MNITRVKYYLLRLGKWDGICFNKIPIKLPGTIGWDGKEVSLQEAEENSILIKNGYLLPGTQCLINFKVYDDLDKIYDDTSVEISFGFMYCVVDLKDEDVFTMWDLYKYRLEEKGIECPDIEVTHVD